MRSAGMATAELLIFTLLIWALYALVLISSPKNKVNQWCCIGGFLLGMGVFKEYIYDSGLLAGVKINMMGTEYEADMLCNSVMTALLYYFAMPCAVVMGLYFVRADQRYPRLFQIIRILLLVPAAAFVTMYPLNQTRVIPETNPSAYTVVAVYNILYGLAATILVVWALAKERNDAVFSQRRLVSVIVLLPMWYWLITVFGFHLLGWENLYKAWQGNAVIILCLFIYYLYNLFHNGIWGLRLSREYFEWSKETDIRTDNAGYIAHMLKNEMSKLKLGTQFIREREIPGVEEELAVMERSIAHVEEFARKCADYTGELHIVPEVVNVKELFENVVLEQTAGWKGTVKMNIDTEDAALYCDPIHMREVLCNLTANALDAMGEEGTLTLSYRELKKEISVIQVTDTGHGIPSEDLGKIFEMYYSEYSDSHHFGMGLTYCKNAVQAHGGSISVTSSTAPEHHGTEFTLLLPKNRKRRKKDGRKDH